MGQFYFIVFIFFFGKFENVVRVAERERERGAGEWEEHGNK